MTDKKINILVEMQGNAIKKLQGMQGTVDRTAKSFNLFEGAIQGVGFAITNIAFDQIGRGFEEIKDFSKSSIDASLNYEKALLGLNSILNKFTINQDDALASVKTLTEDGLISQVSAMEGLQNLLNSGLNLDKATELMKRFKNEAVFGKSSVIDMDTAIQNLAFAYKTQNSTLGDASGLSENFSDIIEKGTKILEAQGVATEDITEEMAKYAGIMEITTLTLGNTDLATEGLIGKQALLGTKTTELKQKLGNELAPIVEYLTEKKLELIEKVSVLAEKWLPILTNFIIDTVIPRFLELKEKIKNDIIPSIEQWYDIMKKAVNDIQESLEPFIEWFKENFESIMVSGLTAISIGFTILAINAGASAVATITAMAPVIIALAPIVAIIGVLAVGAGLLHKAWVTNFGGIREKTKEVTDFLLFVFGNIVNYWDEKIKPSLTALTDFFKRNWDSIKIIVRNTWEEIKEIIKIYINIAWGLISTTMKLLQGDWRGAWNQVKETTSTIWDSITKIMTGKLETAKEAIIVVVDAIRTIIENMFNYITEKVNRGKEKLNSIGDFAKKFDPTGTGLIDMLGLANGGDFITNGPMPIMVGDNASGREHVTVTPLGVGETVNNNQKQNINITVNVSGGGDGHTIAEQIKKVLAEQNKLSKMNISY